ncbi:methanol dehydrogenase regulatory protein [Halosimplex carlsbadense 2-9-1]|uniref:Methanol dehydrogenase regulatory protein n=1 Tax=Halosimplex carlsbadense 2-9-1 TaxID=797114 RepID=M0D280_9EURY|nr:MoxR family ATPase [Halosimplex carlsbadense]ELZ29611.1 methanol dehydrogenase regulatory protein [Halosimplex carlsbadense 2-9-1]
MTDTDTPVSGRQESTVEDVDDAQSVVSRVVDNVEQVIVGHHSEIEHILTALLGRGHILLEDVPGVGKTMLARAVSRSFDGSFKRVQFTPDLLPSDVTGVNVYNQQTETFEFRPGPVFANVVLGDEINRAPPKTQSALLEAMEEDQVTVDGETHSLPRPFTVIATQNTVERDRTYELPMAELDRFMKKLQLGYPGRDEETEMLDRMVGHHPIDELKSVATLDDLRRARETAANVTVEESVRAYVTRLSQFTRRHAELGVSPRGGLAVLRAAQGRAILEGRDYVIPDDVQTEAEVVFPHRIRTSTDETTPRAVVENALESVRVE